MCPKCKYLITREINEGVIVRINEPRSAVTKGNGRLFDDDLASICPNDNKRLEWSPFQVFPQR